MTSIARTKPDAHTRWIERPVTAQTWAPTALTRDRRLHWRADGELHPCQECFEQIFYNRRLKRWLDDDGREHSHPPLPSDWHGFRSASRARSCAAWWNR
ncbi:MAG: hypothetical protein ACR2NO_07805 [Chloroflexota bacterium]